MSVKRTTTGKQTYHTSGNMRDALETVKDAAESQAQEILDKESEPKKDFGDTSYDIDYKMQAAGKVIKAVNKKFQNNPVYTSYVEFVINGLHLSTVSQNVDENIVMSLLNEKNGSGEANKFTIQIAYSPLSNTEFDINKIDNAILASAYTTKDNLVKNAVTGTSRYCALRYGYGDENNDLYRTPWYFGMVLDYSVEFQDGMLIYTITGFSGLTVLKESKDPLVLEIPKSAQDDSETTEGETTDSNVEGVEAGQDTATPTSTTQTVTVKPTEAVELLVRKYLQGGIDTSEDKDKGVEINGTLVKVKRQPLSSDVCYDIKYIGDTRGSDQPVVLETQIDKNPAQAITDILGKAILSDDYKAIVKQKETSENNSGGEAPEDESGEDYVPIDTSDLDEEVAAELNALDKTYYSWFISDTNNENPKFPSGTIYVYKNNPIDSKNKQADVDLVFNWMSPGKGAGDLDHMVLSFKPEYKGSVGLAVMNKLALSVVNDETKEEIEKNAEEKTAGEKISEVFNGAFTVDNMGRLKRTENSISPPVGGDMATVLASIEQEKSSWAEAVQYPYTATLVTLGIPCEIPITGRIKVVPMIYGKPHASAGVYMVLGIRDMITTAGFQTEWELMKIEIPAIKSKYSQSKEDDTGESNLERTRREWEEHKKSYNNNIFEDDPFTYGQPKSGPRRK